MDRMTAARKAINGADATEDDSEPISESDSLEIPAEEGSPDDDGDDGYEEERGELRNLDPEDATAEIWSGDDVDLAAMITSSLRENHIPYRSDSDTPEPQGASEEMSSTRLFVLPEDEKRAKEIVREIVDAAPPH